MSDPPNLYAALTRSALYRLRTKKYTINVKRRRLGPASRRHRGETTRIVRVMASGRDANNHRDRLIAALVSFGTLNYKTSPGYTTAMHFAPIRKIIRSIGGPLNLHSSQLSTVLAYFECLYGSPKASYIWQGEDMKWLLEDLNTFLARIWNLWTLLDGTTEKNEGGERDDSSMRDAFLLHPLTGLHEAFTRPIPQAMNEIEAKDKMTLIFQLTCLLMLCLIVLDYALDPEALQTYMQKVNQSIEAADLAEMPLNNHMWMIQAHDQSVAHHKRIWQGVSFTFLLKHTPYSMQLQIRDWLLASLEGGSVAERRRLRLGPFDFSYAQ